MNYLIFVSFDVDLKKAAKMYQDLTTRVGQMTLI